MPKPILSVVKLQIPAGQANPAPPVGPALGQYGVNIMEFCKSFNEKTKGKEGFIIPVVITIYTDKSFTYILKTPPTSVLLKKFAGIETGSGAPNKQKVGKVTKQQIKQIAEIKMPDLNTDSIDSAIRIVEGTAKSMGIEIETESGG